MAGTRAASLAPRRRAAAGRGALVRPGALARLGGARCRSGRRACGAHEAPAACPCCLPAARRGAKCSTSAGAGAAAQRPRAVAVSAAGNAASSPPPEAAGGAQSSPRDAGRLRAVAGFEDFGGGPDEADAMAMEGEGDAFDADDAGCIVDGGLPSELEWLARFTDRVETGIWSYLWRYQGIK